MPLWGTADTGWSDYNAPRSVNLRVSVPDYFGDFDYDGSIVFYVYPMHAKLWIGADLDNPDGFSGDPVPLTVYVYWQDANGRYPQSGIDVQFTLDTSSGEAILGDSMITTNEDGYAITYLMNYQSGETITVTATIDEQSICSECSDWEEGWFWTDSFTFTS